VIRYALPYCSQKLTLACSVRPTGASSSFDVSTCNSSSDGDNVH